MSLRDQFTEQLKASMKAGDAPRTSTLRMILARLKDVDIAARPKGIDKVPDEDVLGMLRGMVKSRRESVEMYKQGNRPELVAKEEADPVRLLLHHQDQRIAGALVRLGQAQTRSVRGRTGARLVLGDDDGVEQRRAPRHVAHRLDVRQHTRRRHALRHSRHSPTFPVRETRRCTSTTPAQSA